MSRADELETWLTPEDPVYAQSKCCYYDEAAEIIKELEASPWIFAETKPESGRKVIAQFTNSHSKRRTVMACWVAERTEEQNADTDWHDYDEDADVYWIPEGWYEEIYSDICEYSAMHLDETIERWTEIPK